MEIIFFNNRCQKFFESLEASIRPRAGRTFELLEQYGHALGMPHSKALGGGLFELRIIGKVSVRFAYAFYAGRIWMLHGFVKKTSGTPKQDIEYAKIQLKALLH